MKNDLCWEPLPTIFQRKHLWFGIVNIVEHWATDSIYPLMNFIILNVTIGREAQGRIPDQLLTSGIGGTIDRGSCKHGDATLSTAAYLDAR